MRLHLHPLATTGLRAAGLVTLMAAASASAEAAVVTLGDVITNGEFRSSSGAPSLDGWTPTGTTAARRRGHGINQNGGNAGFNGFFGSTFAVLGDLSGGIGGPANTGVSAISQSFTLDASVGGQSVESYDLAISFLALFDGRDDWAPNRLDRSDRFVATLESSGGSRTLLSLDSNGFPSGVPSVSSPDAQLGGAFDMMLVDLQPGTYTLTFALNESAAGGPSRTNTAAGVDAVKVEAAATLAVPEPGTLGLLGIALGSLLVAGHRARRPAYASRESRGGPLAV